ncbi:MAG: DNA polymerase I [Pseudomonadota bacterium]
MAKRTKGGETPLKAGDHLYLIDGSAYIFRAYHALPPLTRKSDGLPVGAVSGFCNMLFKLLVDARGDGAAKDGGGAGEAWGAPTHLAVIFDHSSVTFRNEIYPDYKANRAAPPEDLVPQFPLIRDAVRAFSAPCIELEGFEADDIIATYARQAEALKANVTIVSSDKDLMQLVSGNVEMLDTMKGKRIDRDGVFEKFGAYPEKVVDIQALAGDSVDNIPGVPGIGVKTAAQLIDEYGDLEALLSRAEEIKQTKRRERLIENADLARLSLELVTLRTDAPVEESLDAFALKELDAEKLVAFLKEMEFSTLTRRVEASAGAEAAAPAPATDGSEGSAIDRSAYEIVTDLARLDWWVDAAFEAGLVAVDTETDSLNAMQARLVGVSLAIAPGKACYIPLAHGRLTHGEDSAGSLDLGGEADAEPQLEAAKALERLRPLLTAPDVMKIGQNIKYDILVLSKAGVEAAPIDDTMLISNTLEAGLHGHGMDELARLHLDHETIAFSDVAGKGKAKKTFDQIPISEAAPYAAEDADVTFRLHAKLKRRLAGEGRLTVYETLERPLAPVLASMEREGVKVSTDVLGALSADFTARMKEHEAAAHDLAGEDFNLGSAKQVSELLFGKLGLPGGKKTPKGAWSTKADVLESLAAEGHDLPREILAWRGLSKLISTYTDSLPKEINPQTGRIHTSYMQTGAVTGRLSSTDPNLQNIPIRTEDGRKIRTAFVPERGNVLVSADYSQIELRLLAHVADLPSMKKAFADGVDIHALTASEMFGVPVEGMDASVRRQAKAINFGIIYGISAFGLANNLGIERGEARDYIAAYFEKFPGIRDYMDRMKAFAKEHGFVETVFGRRCHIKDINAKIPAMRGYGERQAINAPLQGAAADIIRRAMIRMPDALAEAGLSARMLLQVHDELVFECPKGEADALCALVRDVMQSAPEPAVSLSVPLVVEAGVGQNWDEAH